MSTEYISREAAIAAITPQYAPALNEILVSMLRRIPAADVVELPCKVGTKVWFVKTSGFKPEIIETEVEKIGVKKSGMYIKLMCNSMYETAISAIGRSVFFTREEAETKMDGERKGGDGDSE